MNVTIRRASAEDMSAMMSLAASADTSAHWSPEHYAQIFSQPGREAFIADSPDGVMIGFLVAHILGEEWEIENVVVTLSHRHTGVGKALIAAALKQARAKGASHVQLEVRASNAAAVRLYEATGFRASGRRKNYYSGPVEDALLFTLQLT